MNSILDDAPTEGPHATLDDAGLTSAEARRRLGLYGPNAVAEAAPRPWRRFFAKFWAPVPWMLEGAIVLQLGLQEYVEAAVIGALLVLNAALAFLQEGKANATLDALKKKLAQTTSVRRDGVWIRVPSVDLVPGDVVRLPLGAFVSADTRILSGAVLVDQSTVTGESVPIEASPGAQVYAGGLIRRGQAIAEVTATGSSTYFGKAAELVRVAHGASTEQAAVLGTVRNLAIVNGAVAFGIVTYAHLIALPAGDLIRLALTALLASIPVALPATFTLSAAISAQLLARHGILLTRLSAAHEAAAMDLLCSDKTGTLTRNSLTVDDVAPMAGFSRERVLELAAFASSEADQDPIDSTIRAAAVLSSSRVGAERLVRFIPFDPATRMAEAFIVDRDGTEWRIVKGAFHAVIEVAETPSTARALVDELARQGERVIAVAVGPSNALRLAGLIALSDPPREDSENLIASLRDTGVRTVMITGDSPVTAGAIAGKVGITGPVCPPERFAQLEGIEACGVFARVVPEEKYRLVKALQDRGHVVGMCGDGANDGPALRQAQIGIAVSSATDIAKAAAAMVLTQPGLAGIVLAVREGRVAFQRLLTYTLSMVVKKIEVVLFLALGLVVTGHAVMTPVLMVLLLVTNDFLSMSITTDRASPGSSPSVWPMGRITMAGVLLGLCKLGFSMAMLMFGKVGLALTTGELQTLSFATLTFGNQAVLYAIRDRRHLWRSRPSRWVLASSAVDIGIVTTLALTGLLIEPLPGRLLAFAFAAAAGFAFVLDQIKSAVIPFAAGDPGPVRHRA